MPADAQTIHYTVSEDGIIIDLSERTWVAFAAANAAPALLPDAVVGRPLDDFLFGDEVRASYRAFHEALLAGVVTEVSLQCHCDAPALRRAHRLLIGLERRDGRPLLRYTSTILSEVPQPEAPVLLAPTADTPGATGAVLTICSYCKRMRLPPDAEEGSWLPAWLYEKQGSSLNVRLSHGLCQDCREQYVNPVLAKLQQRRPRPA